MPAKLEKQPYKTYWETLCQHDVSRKSVDMRQGRLKPAIKIKCTALHKHSNGKIGLEDEKTEFQQIKMGKKMDFAGPNGR